ncbi:putative FMNH2-utilizing oxygenase [Actinoplanes cyaneus]|uniref:FMNH2-utilizing oxygenase n=1 Tax=Actinoplanes cyaneus TaxID=52696 RepID=A0A919M418_9ACTN|nr:LLM class flavin-dependent oxidoreductase [Actinoplanes cyaneus]MCW2137655.1 Flavin-dependent oxidoreductase, luciferase family (includes alkanesulfonate monooxygenase SsuD and methylene tetrahydromethanopterin reductase) [Actinoplanes cyaneus]GID65137.1 putative FMNH2-utilizing oxygenase [Actinoplanes cyaneus]
MTLQVAVALDDRSFAAQDWVAAVQQADDARLDFVTFDDAFGRRGPDAVLVASRVAPVTRHIGLVPVATTTHTEPFHLSTALATLDWVSRGRAGWQVRVSADPAEADLLGQRAPLGFDDLFTEAADAVEVVRRLWDSWEDDAIIKDVATGRFVDRDKLHYIDFAGEHFTVKGPSIVPRPPQGQPVIAALTHQARVWERLDVDVYFVTPADVDNAATIVRQLPAEKKVFADVVVFLDADQETAIRRRGATTSDAAVFAGTPAQLADLIASWEPAGIAGVRLRPGTPADLTTITGELTGVLRERGLFAPSTATTLRERLGLPVAVNRYSQEAANA